MIPTTNQDLQVDIEVEEMSGLGFKMNFSGTRITSLVDGVESVKQAIFMILNVERYEYLIYSWDFGVELKDLFGEPISYVCPEIERRVREALMMDDRITEVNNFEFDYATKGVVYVTFNVETIYGNLEHETVVRI